MLAAMLANYGQGSIFVDLGTNIGTHTLYAAKRGHLVYGVEPQEVNLVRVRKLTR